MDGGRLTTMATDPNALKVATTLLRQGRSVRQVEAELQRQGLQMSRGSIGNLRQKLLGAAEPDPAVKARQLIQETAAAQPAAPATGEPPSYLADLRALYSSAKNLATLPGQETKLSLAAGKQAADLLQQLLELERSSAEGGPRVVFYYPHEMTLQHGAE